MNRRDRKQIHAMIRSNTETRRLMEQVSQQLDDLQAMLIDPEDESGIIEPLHPWYELNDALLRRRALVVL